MKKIYLLPVIIFLLNSLNYSQNGYDGIFFAEYFEGSSNQKAIEIYNGNRDGITINVNRIRLRVYNNGATSPNSTTTLSTADDGTTTTLAWNSNFLIYANAGSGTVFTVPADLPNAPSSRRRGYSASGTALSFNGDDALELQYDSDGLGNWVTVDIFGVIGQDPGAYWSGGGIQTQDRSLERDATVNIGISTNPASFDPSVEWNDNGNITTPITTLGQHTTNNPLPVELSSFSASVLENAVKLNWRTETEVSNYGFEVQRSEFGVQGSEFSVLGFVEGHGNTNSPKEYNFTDDLSLTPTLNRTLYYRLKQIDTDGKFEYSKIVEVEIETPSKFELAQNYPNPFNPTTKIEFWIVDFGFVSLKVYDLLGNEVVTLVNENKSPGKYEVEFNIHSDESQNLPSGIYFYQLKSGSTKGQTFVTSKKMLLLK